MYLIGYLFIPFILGCCGFKAAKKGEKKSKMFMIIMDAIAVLVTIGGVTESGSIRIENILMIIVALVFTILIIVMQKK